MSCVHYKFKSSLDYQTVTFDGLHISLGDLKKAISQHKKLKPGEYNLEITNAQTREVYVNNSELIPKNSSVIVSRIPIQTTTSNSTSKAWEAFKQECAKAIQQEKEMVTLEDLKKTADLANAKATEMDKIKAMIDQSTKDFDPSNYKTKSLPTGPPPSTYRCYRCNLAGHYIHNCPNPKLKVKATDEDGTVHELEPKLKRSTGIPNSLLTYVNNPLLPGVLLTQSGKFAVPTLDVAAYIRGKKEKPPFLPNNDHDIPVVQKQLIPKELMCPICEDLLRDAVITPCCENSFCDECIRNALVESDEHECPQCHEMDVSPNQLTQNKFQRMAVTNFLNETSMLNEQKEESPPPPPPPYPPPQEVVKPPLPTTTPSVPVHNTTSERVSSRRSSSENHSSYSSQHRPPAPHHSSDKSYSHSDRAHHHDDRPPYHQSDRAFSSRHTPRQPQLTVVPIQETQNHSSPAADEKSVVRDERLHSASDSLIDTNAQTVPSLVGRSGLHTSNAHSSDSDDLRPPGTEKVLKKPEKLLKEDDILEKWLEYEKKYDKKNVVPPPVVVPPPPVPLVPPPQPYAPIRPVISVTARPLLPPPPAFMGPPPGVIPIPIPTVMPPIAAPPGFAAPPFLPGPPALPFAAAPFAPVPKPLTKHEFYREQDRLRKQESEIRKRDFMDDFEQELREKKTKKIIPKPIVKRSRSRTYSRSPSRSPRSRNRSKSRSRSRSRSRVYSRSRSRSFSRGGRFRSRSPRMRSRSRSLTRSPRRRSRTRSRSRKRSFSRSRTRSRSRKRSRLRSRSWTRSRSRSYTPLPRKLSRSRSRSRSPYSRRKSPAPYVRHSHSPPADKRFRPKGGKERGYNRERSPFPRFPNHSPPRRFSPDQYPPFGFDVQKQDPYYPGVYQSGMYPGYGGDKWGYPPPVPPGVAPVAQPFDGYMPNTGPSAGYRRSRSKSPWKFGSGGPIPPGEVENWSRGDKHWNENHRPDGRDMVKDHVNDRRNMGEAWNGGDRREGEVRWEMGERWNPADRRTQDEGKRDLPDRRDRDFPDRRDNNRDRNRKDHSDRKEIYDRKDPHYKKTDSKRSEEKPKESSEKPKESSEKPKPTKERREKVKIDRDNKENTNQDRKSDVKSIKEHGKKSVEKSDEERKGRKPPKELKTKEEKVVRKRDDERDEAKTKLVKGVEGKKKKFKVGITSEGDSRINDSEPVGQSTIKKKDLKDLKDLKELKAEKSLQMKPKFPLLKGKTRIEASDGSQSDNMPGKLKVKRVKKKRLKSVAEPTEGEGKAAEQTDAAPEFDLRQKLKKRTHSQSQDVSDDSSPSKRIKTDGSESEVRGSQIQVLSRMKPIPIKLSDSPKDEVMSVMPELSKWERDDYEEEVADDAPKTVTDKKPLPRSVIESAEKVLSQKQMKPSTVASAIASVPGRSRTSVTSPTDKAPHRRVYLENLKTVESEDRRVSNKQKSIEVTISSDKVDSSGKRKSDSQSRTNSTENKVRTDKEERERKHDAKRSSERHSRSDESRSYITKSREDRTSDKERICEFRSDTDNKEVKVKTKNENREKVKPGELKEERRPSKERSGVKEEVSEKKDDKADSRVCETKSKHSDSEDGSRKHKSVSSSEQTSVKSEDSWKSRRPSRNSVDTDVHKQSSQDGESVSDSKSNMKSQGQTQKKGGEKIPLDRKESIIDEATFEPDYEESAESESDGEVVPRSAAEPSHNVHTTSSASRSSDDETSPTKKQRTDDEKHKSKKAKHKKHKHKNKHSKHKNKHKHKKHKKHREEKDEKLS